MDLCLHCGHYLREHVGQPRQYDDLKVFVCRCGCAIDGSVNKVQDGGPDG
jgi:hypothetical protein